LRQLLLVSLVFALILASWPVVADTIIMISAAEPPGEADQAIIDHVAALGFDVESHSQDEAQPVDTSAAVAVIIGEAISSGNIAGAYKDTDLPVVITESYVLDDMQLATDGTFNTTPDMAITIVDPGHPIVSGFSGTVDIASEVADICSTSDILGDVNIIATTAIGGEVCLATYEEGANAADGVPVPARRVFTFHNAALVPLLNDAGWTILERSVLWALGRLSSTAVTPEDAMATTWGDLKAGYR
jgi:hypothetical protein